MLQHPSKFYIYYLFSERRLDVGQIVQLLGDINLPVPQSEKAMGKFVQVLLRERRRMRFPPGFNPLKRPLDPQTDKFLRDWRIRGMWLKDPAVDAALDVLVAEPHLRRFLEVLLLGPLQRRFIADKARQYFSLSEARMNTAIVRLYEHYFWNHAALNKKEWRDIAFHWLPGRNDDLLTAINATHDQVGAAMSLLAAGVPNSVKPVAMYQAGRDMLFRMFMEHSLQDRPSLARTQAACMAIQGVTHAEEQLDRHRGGGAELIHELQRIETQYDHSDLTTVNELPLVPKALPPGERLQEPALSDEAEKEPT